MAASIGRSVAALCLAALTALAAVGCATATGSFGGLSASSSGAEIGGRSFASEEAFDAPAARGSTAPLARAAAEPSPQLAAPLAADAVAPGNQLAAATAAVAAPTLVERLRVYSASLGLVVDNVATAKDRIVAIAEDSGGYVESAFQSTVVVRVPATRFDAILAEIESGGRVQNRTVRTSDVTERVGDLESRLRVARQTRDRLNELLQRTQDAEERVRVLAEIRRLTEQIDQMQIALTALQEQVALSRIAVQLISRIAQDAVDRQRIPFAWIAALEPLYATLWDAQDWTLDLGEEYAVFDGPSFTAESADGTRVRVGLTVNEPRGDAVFWQRALEHHLAPLYDTAEPFTTAGFIGVLLRSKDREPFYYLVAVAAAGVAADDELPVAEAFYPNEEAFERRHAALLDVLAGAEAP